MIFRRSGDLICLDPETGEVLWERDDVRIESEIWGDDELVFAHMPESPNGGGGGKARVFSVFDGRELPMRTVPKQINRLRTFGRHVVSWQYVAGASLKLDPDADTNKVVDDILKAKPLIIKESSGNKKSAFSNRIEMRNVVDRTRVWSRNYHFDARAAWINQTDLAIFDPMAQKVEILDVMTGEKILEGKIETDLPKVDTLEVKVIAGLYTVILGQKSQGIGEKGTVQFRAPSSLAGLKNYEVHAFAKPTQGGAEDRTADQGPSEMLWGIPAKIDNHQLLPTHAGALPILVFARKHEARGSRSKRLFETIVIDVRDGRSIFSDAATYTGGSKFSVTGQRGTSAIDLTLPPQEGATWTLRFTDKPRPPAPPFGYETEQSKPEGKNPFDFLPSSLPSSLPGAEDADDDIFGLD